MLFENMVYMIRLRDQYYNICKGRRLERGKYKIEFEF